MHKSRWKKLCFSHVPNSFLPPRYDGIGYGAGRPKRTPVRDSKCDALYNQGQGNQSRNDNHKVLSSSYDDG